MSQPKGSASKKRSILVLTSTFPRWAGDTEPPFVFELCRRLAADFRICILAPHAKGASRREVMDGIEVVRYRYFVESLEVIAYEGGITAKLGRSPINWLIVPFFLLGQWCAIRRLLTTRNFDLIHAHWLIPQGLIALLAARRAMRPPILCTSHGGDLFGLRGKILEGIKRYVLVRTAHNTVVSDAMKSEARRIAGSGPTIDVIPMGADLRYRFVPPTTPRHPRSLLFVGRLVEKKGLQYLLRALPPLVKEFPDLKLEVAGDGPGRTDMEQLVSKLALHDHVRFIGRTPNENLPALYQAAEICIFPSVVARDGDQEGLGLVPIEALGCGCAVLASKLPATETFLRDGFNALLVPPEDTRALEEGIRTLFNDSDLRTKLGLQGRASVLEQFDWTSIANQYAQVMQSLAPVCTKS